MKVIDLSQNIFYFRTWVDANLVAEVCGESYQCKYDYSTSLSREFAIFTKYYQDQFVNIREGVLKPEARGKIINIIVYCVVICMYIISMNTFPFFMMALSTPKY